MKIILGSDVKPKSSGNHLKYNYSQDTRTMLKKKFKPIICTTKKSSISKDNMWLIN